MSGFRRQRAALGDLGHAADADEPQMWINVIVDGPEEPFEDVHTLPLNDWRPHFAERECFCRPTAEILTQRVELFVHHTLDGREGYEQGHREAS